MSLGSTEIPAGVDVIIKAKLSADRTPAMMAKVKQAITISIEIRRS